MKIREITDAVAAYHPQIDESESCDGFKCGNPEDECTGVVSALVPTVEVIRKTAALGCNLLFIHEPIFYQTPDFPTWRGPFRNEVYEEKRELLEKYGIAVFRDHDRIHSHEPDGIFTGVLKYLGWLPYYRPEANETPFLYRCDIPETTVGELCRYLKEKLGMNGMRYIGRSSDKVSRVGICGHLYPGAFCPDDGTGETYNDYATRLIGEMEKEDGIQVLIPGEIIEWDLLSYIRDAAAMGKTRACINAGHFNMEELGMKYAADWLTELTEGKVPVHYVPTGDIFNYYKEENA